VFADSRVFEFFNVYIYGYSECDCLFYILLFVNIFKAHSIDAVMPAVAGSKKGKKNVDAKAAVVDEKEGTQVGFKTLHWTVMAVDVVNTR